MSLNPVGSNFFIPPNTIQSETNEPPKTLIPEYTPTFSPPPLTPLLHLRARFSLSSQNYPDAIDTAESLLKENPQNALAIKVKAEALYCQEKYREVVEFMSNEELLNDDCLTVKAAALLKLQCIQPAFALAHRVYLSNPHHVNAAQILVQSGQRLGFYELVLEVANARLAVNQSDEFMKTFKEDACKKINLRQADRDEAIKTATTDLEKNPADIYSRNTLARALTDLSVRYTNGKDMLQQAQMQLDSVHAFPWNNDYEKCYALLTSAKILFLRDQITQAYETVVDAVHLNHAQNNEALTIFNKIQQTLKSSRSHILNYNIKARALVDKVLMSPASSTQTESLLNAQEIANNILMRQRVSQSHRDFANATLAKVSDYQKRAAADPDSLTTRFGPENAEVLETITQISLIEIKPMLPQKPPLPKTLKWHPYQ